jgi:hypothetical protein
MQQVQQLLKALPVEKHEEVATNLELAMKAATSARPNRSWYSVSADGLMEASKYAKDFSGNIASALTNVGKGLWPDFLLPQGKK